MNASLAIAWAVWLKVLRRKDVYVLFILLGALLMTLTSLNVFGLGAVTGYVKDIGLLLTWVFGWILAVTLTSRELPQEESRRTIYALLAKPIGRFALLAGKWLGCWTVVTAATAAFYGLIYLVVLAMGGAISEKALAQAGLLHSGALAIICAVALLFSTRLNHDAAATLTYVVSLASFAVVPRVPEFAAQTRGLTSAALLALYHLLPHFEILDMRRRVIHDYGPAAAGVIGLVLTYAAVITALLLVAAWLCYRHKRFSRSTMAL